MRWRGGAEDSDGQTHQKRAHLIVVSEQVQQRAQLFPLFLVRDQVVYENPQGTFRVGNG
jgi:hypothetical protein